VSTSPGAQSLRTPYDAQLIPSHKLGAAHFLLEKPFSFIRLGVLPSTDGNNDHTRAHVGPCRYDLDFTS
jgi:hypothetical protein